MTTIKLAKVSEGTPFVSLSDLMYSMNTDILIREGERLVFTLEKGILIATSSLGEEQNG